MKHPHVTEEQIRLKIRTTTYFVIPDTTTTLCTLTLINGYDVTGRSACVHKENYNKEVGENLAYTAALSQIWPLEGYLLAEQLYQERPTCGWLANHSRLCNAPDRRTQSCSYTKLTQTTCSDFVPF